MSHAAAMPPIGHEVISASAGTGKTFQLALRYIRLLSLGVRPESIVALTFSRKAAGEIFDKIVQRLTEWLAKPDLRRDQTAAAGMPCFTDAELTAMLRRMLLASHQLRIGTLDSFYVGILRAFPFEFGLCGDFAILDEHLQQEARTNVLNRILQGQAADADRGPFLETFKQATFGHEEKSLHARLEAFTSAHHELFLALPEAAGWGDPDRIWPHGCAILQASSDRAADAAELSILLEKKGLKDNQWRRWQDFLAALPEFSPAAPLPGPLRYIVDRALPALADLGNEGVHLAIERGGHDLTPTEGLLLRRLLLHMLKASYVLCLQRTQGIRQILRLYEDTYHRQVRTSGRMSFRDLLFLLSPLPGSPEVPLLCQQDPGPDRLFIEYRLDGRFDHWLLDEFQDTSLPQWLIVRNLIDEVMQDDSGRRSFFYVGDIKQSIYGWRGGDARLFTAVRDGFQERYGNLHERPLDRSWRSSPTIITTVNQVFDHLGELGLPTEATSRFTWRSHSTARTDLPGHAALVEFEGDDQATDRAAWIGEKLRVTRALERGLGVAVLTRNNEQGAKYSRQLREIGIPTSLEGDAAIADNPLVMACLALVRLAAHPGDEFAWQHLRMTPFREQIEAASSRGALCRELLAHIHDGGFHGLIQAWTNAVPAVLGGDPFFRQRLGELLAAARLFDRSGNRDALSFCSYVASYQVPGSTQPGAVRIMTIHKAKGLEFDLVFLPEMKNHNLLKSNDDGIVLHRDAERVPHWALLLPRRTLAEADPTLADLVHELDHDNTFEQLCVLYVAMTRARQGLYMLIGKPAKKPEARYLEDLLRETLVDPAPDTSDDDPSTPTVRWSCGNPDWADIHPEKPAPRPRPTPRLDITVPAQRDIVNPSALETETISAIDLFTGRPDRSLDLGSAMHELLAAVAWTDDPGFDPAAILAAWRRTTSFPSDIAAAAAALFAATLGKPDIKAALARPADAVDLWREQRFDVVHRGHPICGCFDRVILHGTDPARITGAEILDFKSDQAAGQAALAERVAVHAPQMRLYRDALAILTGLPPCGIRIRLLFLRPGRAVEIT